MARPPKGEDDQRSEILRCRMRPAEYLRILRAAERSNLSLSDYTRTMLLSGTVSVMPAKGPDPETFDQLRRIGINLNQAVHKLHATGRIPPELASAAATVESFILGMIDGS
jgi:mobilization protein NikA